MSDVVSDVVEEQEQESETEASVISPGAQLKKARENKHLEQLDVAKELKLDLRFVEALEEGRLNELPQPVYTAGYIRAYSKLVGLSPDEVVAKYTSSHKISAASENGPLKEEENIPSHYRNVQESLPKSFSVGHGSTGDSKKFQILVSFLLLLVLLAIGWQLSLKEPEPSTTSSSTEMPLKPQVQEGLPKDEQVGPGESDKGNEAGLTDATNQDMDTIKLPLPAVEPDSKGLEEGNVKETQASEKDSQTQELADNAEKLLEISLHYTEDSWVDIRDATGKAIIRKLGVAGSSSTVSGIAPFEVLLGYSPGVSIEQDGKAFDLSAFNKKRVARFVLKSDGDVEKSRDNPLESSLNRTRRERSEPFAFE